MASAYFRKLLDEQGVREVETRSAGVMTITGLLASQEAIQVMTAEGVDLHRHRSTQLTPELIRKADLILAMSPFHRQTALRMCEDAKNKTFLLKEYTRSDLKNVQIADPMGCTLEVFKKCFKEIKSACDRLIDHEFITGKPATPRPAAKKPVAKPNAKNNGKVGAKSAAKPMAKPAPKPAPKPVAKPAAKPVAKVAVKTKKASSAKAPAKPIAKSTVKSKVAVAAKTKGTRE